MKWEEAKKLSGAEARERAMRLAPPSVNEFDGGNLLGVLYHMARAWFPREWALDPSLALARIFDGLMRTATEIPRDEFRIIADHVADMYKEASNGAAEHARSVMGEVELDAIEAFANGTLDSEEDCSTCEETDCPMSPKFEPPAQGKQYPTSNWN